MTTSISGSRRSQLSLLVVVVTSLVLLIGFVADTARTPAPPSSAPALQA